MADTPTRDQPPTHQCVCLIGTWTIGDRCAAIIDNPDQAFCDECEDYGHPDHPAQLPVMPPPPVSQLTPRSNQ